MTIFKNSSELYRDLAAQLALRLQKPQQIGFATGKTMEPLYKELRQLAPFKVNATAWILDEYLGLSANHPQSYRYFLNELILNPLGFNPSSICFPALEELPLEQAVMEYEAKFKQTGGLDLQLLGLGTNGHVGLNEPGSDKESRTRVVEIAEATRISNSSYFDHLSEVPQKAMTLGMANLLETKELWLIVTGSKKTEIVRRVIEGEITQEVPASLLRKHPNLHVFLDQEAAGLLKPVA